MECLQIFVFVLGSLIGQVATLCSGSEDGTERGKSYGGLN